GSASGTWYGIVIDAAATSATLTSALVPHAIYDIKSAAPGSVLSVSNSTFQTATYGVYLSAGSSSITGITATGNSYGIYLTGSAAPTISSCIVATNFSYGVYAYASGGANATTTINGCTL